MSFEKGLIRCCDQRCVDSREDVAGRFINERERFFEEVVFGFVCCCLWNYKREAQRLLFVLRFFDRRLGTITNESIDSYLERSGRKDRQHPS